MTDKEIYQWVDQGIENFFIFFATKGMITGDISPQDYAMVETMKEHLAEIIIRNKNHKLNFESANNEEVND